MCETSTPRAANVRKGLRPKSRGPKPLIEMRSCICMPRLLYKLLLLLSSQKLLRFRPQTCGLLNAVLKSRYSHPGEASGADLPSSFQRGIFSRRATGLNRLSAARAA
ncbi:hypothetical protein NB311A_00665 [Nitrobacter sp. Nb-311A]|nr:hypothetical protein NB311A_00665 [Nitrobacter sp. Nb-311A]